MFPEFDDLDQLAVGRNAAHDEPGRLQRFEVFVVELVAMAVPFEDVLSSVGAVGERPLSILQGYAPRRMLPPLSLVRSRFWTVLFR